MRHGTVLLVLFLVLAVSGCGQPADEPADKWADFLNAHRPLVAEGKFKPEDFLKEGRPLVAELKKHRGDNTGTFPTGFPLSDAALSKAFLAQEDFADAVDKRFTDKGDKAPMDAYHELYFELNPQAKSGE